MNIGTGDDETEEDNAVEPLIEEDDPSFTEQFEDLQPEEAPHNELSGYDFGCIFTSPLG